MSARTRELFGLLPVSLLVAAGFAAVLATRTEDVSDATLTYGAVFLGLCVVAHLFIRARLQDADPYLFPLVALLAAIGSVLIYRIDAELAREQAQWFVVGLTFFCATILLIDATTTCWSATGTRSRRPRSPCSRCRGCPASVPR